MNACVGLVMGSLSDWKSMKAAAEMLTKLNITFELQIISAHRTPDKLFQYAETAVSCGLQVLIAGAGGAAHLPGMLAAKTRLPVLGVPIESESLKGLDSLYSIVQMPKGIPVGTLAIGSAGAANAALLAASILALQNPLICKALEEFRQSQTTQVLTTPPPVYP